MDAQVLNEANLTDALLVRAVLTRSDLGSAVIDGADFSDAVLDFAQKQVRLNFSEVGICVFIRPQCFDTSKILNLLRLGRFSV